MRLPGTVLLVFAAGVASAQVSVDVSGYGVKVQTGNAGGANTVSVESGTVAPDVQMLGVAVVNDEVFIDGDKVPKNRTSYTSRKTGKTYLIRRSKGGNVSVSEK